MLSFRLLGRHLVNDRGAQSFDASVESMDQLVKISTESVGLKSVRFYILRTSVIVSHLCDEPVDLVGQQGNPVGTGTPARVANPEPVQHCTETKRGVTLVSVPR